MKVQNELYTVFTPTHLHVGPADFSSVTNVDTVDKDPQKPVANPPEKGSVKILKEASVAAKLARTVYHSFPVAVVASCVY